MGREGDDLLPARPPGGSVPGCVPRDRRQHPEATDKMLHPHGSHMWMGLLFQAFNYVQ